MTQTITITLPGKEPKLLEDVDIDIIIKKVLLLGGTYVLHNNQEGWMAYITDLRVDYTCPHCGEKLEWWRAFPGGPSKPSKWMCSQCLGSFIAVPKDYQENDEEN